MILQDSGEYIREFATLMAVCHTVVPEKDQNSGELIYQAASPGTVLKTNFY